VLGSLPQQLDGLLRLARQHPIKPPRDSERGPERQRRIDSVQTLEASESEQVVATRTRGVVETIV
jgi:hypothetical protein